MKTDQIDQILHNRLHDMEPVGGAPSWEQFETRRRSKTIIRNLWRTSAAVAASVAVMLILIRPVTQQIAEPNIQATNTPKIENTTPPKEVKPYITPNIRVHHTTTVHDAPTMATIVDIQPIKTENPSKDSVIHQEQTPKPRKAEPKSNYNSNWMANNIEKAKPRRLLAMSTFANISGSISRGQNKMAASSQPMQSDAGPGVLYVQMGRYQNTVDFRNSEVNHKFPISAGVTVSIPIGKGFAIESGLVYTYLESTAETTQDFHYKYQQNVHYLGIPVSVAYKILNIKAIDVYTSVGTTAEMALASNIKTEVYSNDKYASSDSKHIPADGIQMSFNAAVGLNVHLTPRVGIYVEPNITHYLHNANQPITSRTKSDIQFNVRAGFKIQL